MGRKFDGAVKMVNRCWSEEQTKYFFRSLISQLHPDDQKIVVDELSSYVAKNYWATLKMVVV